MKILVVEDEIKASSYLKKGLSENGFLVDTCPDGKQGLALLGKNEYALVILDIMLPGLDGWEILSQMKKHGMDTPVLFLTAKDSVQDRVKGLELGADDYLVKPFAFSELLARVRTILRRGPVRQPDTLVVGDLEIDFLAHRAARQGLKLDLTPKEFSLLSLLARRSGEVVSRALIADQVWGMNFESDTNVVDVAVRRLRRKVDDPFERKLIRTVRGVGYTIDND